MQSKDSPNLHRDDDYEEYLRHFQSYPEEGSLLFWIVVVFRLLYWPLFVLGWLLRVHGWLLRWALRGLGWLLKNPLGRAIKECVALPVVIGMLIYVELLKRRDARIIRMTEKGEGSLTITWPGWFLFENAMKSEVRMCAGDGRGEVPKKLRGRGMVLRPGQKRKIRFPDESFYAIEVYGMDGKRLEQMKLTIAIPFAVD